MSDDLQQDRPPVIDLRIPGPWSQPGELIAALAKKAPDYELTEQALVHRPTGHGVSWVVSEHDDQIADVFAGGTSRLTDEEIDAIARHRVKIHLSAPGGSSDAARAVMRAAAALIRAGGLGGLVDNSGAVHGPGDWLKLADDPLPGGAYWAHVVVTKSSDGLFSTGMHCLGFRDAEMPDDFPDPEPVVFFLHNFLGYLYQSGQTVLEGDFIGAPDFLGQDIVGFIAHAHPCERFDPASPFHNPYGIWRLEPTDQRPSDNDE